MNLNDPTGAFETNAFGDIFLKPGRGTGSDGFYNTAAYDPGGYGFGLGVGNSSGPNPWATTGNLAAQAERWNSQAFRTNLIMALLRAAIRSVAEPIESFATKDGGRIDKLGYSLTIDNFGRVGMDIILGYKGVNETDKLKWFQIVKTDYLLPYEGGLPNRWSIDPQKNSDNYPFFWEKSEEAEHTNYLGYNSVFEDHIGRKESTGKSSFYWQAELSIVRMNGDVREPLGTLSYGFSYGNGSAFKFVMQLIEPEAYHIRLLNRKGY